VRGDAVLGQQFEDDALESFEILVILPVKLIVIFV
jgi:hypothetical protein